MSKADRGLVRVGRGPTGTQLHVERDGSGEPLLWITGFAISSEIFSPVIDTYAAEFDCIRYDNRGGGSVAGPVAGDVHPRARRGRGATAGCTRCGQRPRVQPVDGRHGGSGGRAQLVGKALFSEEFRTREPALARRYLGLLAQHRTSARGLVSHLTASTYHDARARLGRIVAPTLVLHGDRDALTPPENARLLADAIPDATLGWLHGAGHGYLLEQPQESHQLFSSWLAARSPMPPGPPLSGLAARSEPLTRHLGLPVGMLRSARSLTTPSARRGRP